MPASDVCFVLELPSPLPPHFARCLLPGAGAPRPTRPQPDRRQGRRPPLKARCKTARKIRRLTELGYTPSHIGPLLGLPAARVAWLLRGTKRFGAVASPWAGSPGRSQCDEWSDVRHRAAELGSRPPVGDHASAGQAAEVLPAIAAALVNPWIGSAAMHRGRSKLTEADVRELRELRRAGWSTGKIGVRFGVSRATVCYALSGKTWTYV